MLRAEKMHAARARASSASSREASAAARRPAAARDPPFTSAAPAGSTGTGGTASTRRAPRRAEWFEHYASKFKTVELNAPFYSWPTVATVDTWRRQPGRRKFTYAVKVNELITHQKRMSGVKTLVRDFGLIADLLGPRLGCFLFQLPPSFHYSAAALKRVLSSLDPARPNVVEFRHRSWWNERVYAAFRETGTVFCSCSGPRLPDELVKTADDVYVRFHGTKQWYRHDYSKEELAVWAERIRASGARRVWAYFNNDRDGYAIKNARSLMRLLGRHV